MRALALGLAAAIVVPAAAAVRAEVVQKGNLRVTFEGSLAPKLLPRVGTAPVAVKLGGTIRTTDGTAPPQLRTITVVLNRNGRLDFTGLPRCNFHQIQPASTAEAREACRKSLVGTGTFEADVALPEQSPFPSDGKILAFNGNLHGKPVFYAHIYGTEPLPTSFTLPFHIKRDGPGTVLSARLPQVAAEWGFISAVSLTLRRSFLSRGKRRSYLSAGCPAPRGFSGATFVLAKVAFGFDSAPPLSSTLIRSCGVQAKRQE